MVYITGAREAYRAHDITQIGFFSTLHKLVDGVSKVIEKLFRTGSDPCLVDQKIVLHNQKDAKNKK